jgi:Tfp pilus assembly protein PilF
VTIVSDPIPVPVPTQRATFVLAGGIAIVLLTLLAYAPAFYAGYIWDDDKHIVENETLRSADGLRRIWFEPRSIPQYYPVVHTSFWVEYRLWGLEPLGYHLVNVVLHAANALLLWLLLWRLRVGVGLENGAPRRLPGVPWLAAAVFALHPVHVESVAWVTERKNVLSGTFYLAAALALLPLLGLTGEESSRRRRRRYLTGMALFVAALLSKSVTCSLPAALLLLIYRERGRIGRREVLLTAPMFLLGLVAGLHTAYLERVHVGAEFIDWNLSFVERGLIASRAIVFYATKLVWPDPLIFSYPRWQINAGALWQWLFPWVVVGTIATLFFARHRIGRGPLVAVLFFAGTLFPALGFIDVYPMLFSFVADHFQYLASIGVIVLLVASGARLVSERGRAGPVAGLLILATLSVLTFRQALVYWDAETLWRTTIAENPSSWMARDNLARVLQDRADASPDPRQAATLRQEATTLLEESLTLHRDFRAFENLAQARMRDGRVTEAIELYRSALEIDPGSAAARLNLGVALGSLGREREQLAELERALSIEPDYVPALRNLAALRLTARSAELRDPEEARRAALRACELTGWADPMQLVVLAEAESAIGEPAVAVETIDKAIGLVRSQAGDPGLAAALEARRAEYVAASNQP